MPPLPSCSPPPQLRPEARLREEGSGVSWELASHPDPPDRAEGAPAEPRAACQLARWKSPRGAREGSSHWVPGPEELEMPWAHV